MGKAAKEILNRTLNMYLETIEDTYQVVMDPPVSSLERVNWEEVKAMAEHISKQATIAGMLWTGSSPNVKDLEESMNTYFKMLNALLLLSHGSSVGAGPTLRSCIHTSVKEIVDCSSSLLKEAVSSYGSQNGNGKLSIPQLAGTVWNACDTLKKTPTTNYTAIGRAITHVAVSVKDVIREMKELKPAPNNPDDESPDAEDESSSEADIGSDLSPEEMIIAESTTKLVSDTLIVLKELIRFITGLLKRPDHNESYHSVESLERLLELARVIGAQVDELGACLYPPQELESIKSASDAMSNAVNEMKAEIISFQDLHERFYQSCDGFTESLREFQSKLATVDANDLVTEIENLSVSK
ncbi:hypothetical protein ACHQM5_011259 [Ranunculus cassubicifolius]